MDKYRHILLAADFNEDCAQVAAKAKALAALFQAKLSLIHVLDNIPMPDTNYGTVIPLETDSGYRLLEAEKDKFRQLAQSLQIGSDNCWLVWGIPKQEIYQLAEQQAVDLIVLGSHGRHGLASLLGSTADGVLHHAHCDVLAVRITE